MLNILVVDDEENTRLGLSKLLSADGYQVTAVTNGFEALEQMKKRTIELVITDMNMPGMNGLLFLKEISRSFPHMKVIMITAYGGVESYLEAMNLGAFEYLNKPIKMKELNAVIRRIFNRTTNHLDSLGGSATIS